MAYEDETRAPMFFALMTVGLMLCTVVVLVRFVTRIWIKRNAGYDDLSMFFAWAIILSALPVSRMQTDAGFGRHFSTLTDGEKMRAAKWQIIIELQSFTSLFFLRLSVALFLLRLLQGTSFRTGKWVKRALWTITAVNFVATLTVCIVYGTQCVPLKAAWDPLIKGRCHTQKMLSQTLRMYATIGIIVDFSCAFLPYPILHSLEMSKRRKHILYGLLGLGAIPAICSCGKAVYGNNPTTDFTWDWVKTEIFAAYEDVSGIIMASMPAVFSLWQHYHTAPSSQPRRIYSSDNNYYHLSHMPSSDTASKARSQVHASQARGASSEREEEQGGTMPSDEIRVTHDVRVELQKGRPQSLG